MPVVAAAAAAPAFAASPTACTPAACLTSTVTNFGTSSTSTNGWKLTTTGSFYGGGNQSIGWYNGVAYHAGMTSYYNGTASPCPSANTSQTEVALTGPAIVAQGDPKQAGASVTWAKTFCLQAGRTYTFSYNWISYGINTLAAYQSTYITGGNAPLGTAGTQLGTTITASAHTDNQSGTSTFSYTPNVTGTYTFYYYWTFATATSYPSTDNCPTYANDFAVNAPTVTCTG